MPEALHRSPATSASAPRSCRHCRARALATRPALRQAGRTGTRRHRAPRQGSAGAGHVGSRVVARALGVFVVLQERSGTARLALQRLIAAQPVMPAHAPFLSRAQAVRAWRNLHQSYWNLIVGKAATSTTANASLVHLIMGCGPKPEGGRLLFFKEPLRPVQSPPRLRRVVKTS